MQGEVRKKNRARKKKKAKERRRIDGSVGELAILRFSANERRYRSKRRDRSQSSRTGLHG